MAAAAPDGAYGWYGTPRLSDSRRSGRGAPAATTWGRDGASCGAARGRGGRSDGSRYGKAAQREAAAGSRPGAPCTAGSPRPHPHRASLFVDARSPCPPPEGSSSPRVPQPPPPQTPSFPMRTRVRRSSSAGVQAHPVLLLLLGGGAVLGGAPLPFACGCLSTMATPAYWAPCRPGASPCWEFIPCPISAPERAHMVWLETLDRVGGEGGGGTRSCRGNDALR